MSSTKLHTCDCGKIFQNIRSLKRHMNAKHNDVMKIKKCCIDKCRKMYCRNDYLTEHLVRVHNMQRIEAATCVNKLKYTEIPRADFMRDRSHTKGHVQEELSVDENSADLNLDN